jgi:hypothetical protein
MWTGAPYRSTQRVLRVSTVTRVRRVEIWPRGEIIALDGKRLGDDAMWNFARVDGFADLLEMFRWFAAEYGDRFEGVVIYWSNARTERRGRPSASALPTDVARPRSLQ